MPYIVLSNDELAHFKYIKREPDGRGGWRYYYDTGRQKNITGVGKPIYKRETAPVVRPVGRQDVSNRPRRNAAGNYTTKVSDGRKPWNYESSSHRNGAGVTEDMFKRASSERNALLKKQNSGGTLSEREKEDLQYYSKVVNGEGRNMAADKQEASRRANDSEYAKAVADNSKKNNYFGQGSNPGIVTFDSKTGQTVPAGNKPKEPKKTVGDVAKSAVNAISTAAGSAFDKGKKWISGLFK